MNVPNNIDEELRESYSIQQSHIAHFQKYRYIKLKSVFSKALLGFFNEAIGKKVVEKSMDKPSIEIRDTYGKAFLQIFNLWREDEVIKKLVFSKRLAKIASDLMQVKGVRIYHDQALFKEGGGGITPWHADQYYWPLETDKTITAWIPLHSVPLEMGPVEFSAGSHVVVEGRNLKIGDESEAVMKQKLNLPAGQAGVTDFRHVIEPFDLGEVSFHSGWIFHRAGANTTKDTRKVMTVIYMDKEMKLKNPENKNQVEDWNAWCPGAEIGKIIDTPLNPVL